MSSQSESTVPSEQTQHSQRERGALISNNEKCIGANMYITPYAGFLW